VLVGAETQARIADCLLPKQKSPIALSVSTTGQSYCGQVTSSMTVIL
jgi:hypothetical protein